mgnify:CR=1 FL=1
MGRIKLCISLLCLLFLTNCTNLDDVNDRLDKVETKTSKKLPTGISVLRDKLLIAEGGTSCLEFRINPSDASFNYDVNSDSCEIELDCLGLTRSASSYVTPPSNYKLTKIEQAYDEKGALKKGQYRAYITDLGVSKDYSEMIALVLKTMGGTAHIDQICEKYAALFGFSLTPEIEKGVKTALYQYTSDSDQYLGVKDLFKKAGEDTWALR